MIYRALQNRSFCKDTNISITNLLTTRELLQIFKPSTINISLVFQFYHTVYEEVQEALKVLHLQLVKLLSQSNQAWPDTL